jgi:hypothetical protein
LTTPPPLLKRIREYTILDLTLTPLLGGEGSKYFALSVKFIRIRFFSFSNRVWELG